MSPACWHVCLLPPQALLTWHGLSWTLLFLFRSDFTQCVSTLR
jgi:hypothetical protein